MAGIQQDAAGRYRQKYPHIAAAEPQPLYVRAACGVCNKDEPDKHHRGRAEIKKHD